MDQLIKSQLLYQLSYRGNLLNLNYLRNRIRSNFSYCPRFCAPQIDSHHQSIQFRLISRHKKRENQPCPSVSRGIRKTFAKVPDLLHNVSAPRISQKIAPMARSFVKETS